MKNVKKLVCLCLILAMMIPACAFAASIDTALATMQSVMPQTDGFETKLVYDAGSDTVIYTMRMLDYDYDDIQQLAVAAADAMANLKDSIANLGTVMVEFLGSYGLDQTVLCVFLSSDNLPVFIYCNGSEITNPLLGK